mmetsp:Transcript_142504/g.248603  ORF Transcript_142504/g.248603 Transcript_142504/m.248603 type:complete len:97 (+) Transcript_142504:527-817(+)
MAARSNAKASKHLKAGVPAQKTCVFVQMPTGTRDLEATFCPVVLATSPATAPTGRWDVGCTPGAGLWQWGWECKVAAWVAGAVWNAEQQQMHGSDG